MPNPKATNRGSILLKSRCDGMQSHNKYIAIGFGLCLAVVSYLGCKSDGKGAPSPSPTIRNVHQTVTSVKGTIAETTATIKDNATEGQKRTRPSESHRLNPYWLAILTATGKQEVVVKQLGETELQLEQARRQADALERDRNAERQHKEKAQAQAKDALRARLMGLVVLGVVGLAICGALAFAGHRKAIYGAIACAILIGVAVTLAQAMPYVIFGVAAVIIGAAGYLAYRLVRQKQTAKELVQTVEAAKQQMPLAVRRQFFSDGAIPGDVVKIQSDATRREVQVLKESIKRAPSVPATIAADYDPVAFSPHSVETYPQSVPSSARDGRRTFR